MKKVSLVVFRLELQSEESTIEDFYYNAEEYFDRHSELCTERELNNSGLRLQSEQVVVPEFFKEIPELHQGERAYSEIVIETYFTIRDMEGDKQSDKQSDRATDLSSIKYFSGNPLVERTQGILHLYKDKYLTPLDSDFPRSELICIIGVPAKYNCREMQEFIAPAGETIQFMKILRDARPNQYMILIKFRDQLSADSFYQEFEGKPYNLLESEVAHLVYVSRIENVPTSEGGYLPVDGLTEMPTCPVCLERMDESVSGILTVLCNHSFHNDCLMKWKYEGCPVCRYRQTPEEEVDQTCFECDAKESLWICLICGYVGCGRYQEQHAFQHYQQTAHTFSMHLGNQRVWDYAGDNYVHRLLQSKGDGKIVAVNSEATEVDNEKVDSLTLEYSYLLTNQLESQRQFFEQKMNFMEKEAFDRICRLEEELLTTRTQGERCEKKVRSAEKDKKTLEKKYEQVVGKTTNLVKELKDEKQMNQFLRENQGDWFQKVSDLEKRLVTLEEQKNKQLVELQSEITDLMKHLDFQSAIGSSSDGVKEEIQGGQLFTEQASKGGTRPKTKGRKR